MDENGEYKMNVMQMLHGAYNIQNYTENDELKDIWKFVQQVNDEEIKFKKLEEPVLTRWWLVGQCATSFKEHVHIWSRICTGIHNLAPSDSAS